jgi:choice-of-anchor B domain-containing protein
MQMTAPSHARSRVPRALAAPALLVLGSLWIALACDGGGPASPDDDGTVPQGDLAIVWDGRTVDWGADETLRAEIGGQPVDVEWRSLTDFYLGQPVVLGRSAETTTVPFRPGATTVEARILSGGTVLKQATAQVTVRYRESWNMTLEGMIPYEDESVGDVWVSDGHALVTRRHAGGISIVALDGGIREVGRFTAPNMFSQDVVAADGVAYVTNETSTYPFAVTMLDISDPASPRVLGGVPTSAVGVAHTVWLEGSLLALASQVTRAIHLYDVSDPESPAALSSIFALNATAHDIHVRDGRLFGSFMALSAGQKAELVVAGIADPAHPAVMARVHYPGAVLTHSSWLTGNGQILYVTDEIVNAPVRIFDVSDFSRAVLVGTYQPRLGTIPHHFHVRDGRYAYLSHYKHGVEVVDVSDPVRPRLVGFYDTHTGIDADAGEPRGSLSRSHEKEGFLYEGVWGVDWTADGRIVASDMNRGLFVFRYTGS